MSGILGLRIGDIFLEGGKKVKLLAVGNFDTAAFRRVNKKGNIFGPIMFKEVKQTIKICEVDGEKYKILYTKEDGQVAIQKINCEEPIRFINQNGLTNEVKEYII